MMFLSGANATSCISGILTSASSFGPTLSTCVVADVPDPPLEAKLNASIRSSSTSATAATPHNNPKRLLTGGVSSTTCAMVFSYLVCYCFDEAADDDELAFDRHNRLTLSDLRDQRHIGGVECLLPANVIDTTLGLLGHFELDIECLAAFFRQPSLLESGFHLYREVDPSIRKGENVKSIPLLHCRDVRVLFRDGHNFLAAHRASFSRRTRLFIFFFLPSSLLFFQVPPVGVVKLDQLLARDLFFEPAVSKPFKRFAIVHCAFLVAEVVRNGTLQNLIYQIAECLAIADQILGLINPAEAAEKIANLVLNAILDYFFGH